MLSSQSSVQHGPLECAEDPTAKKTDPAVLAERKFLAELVAPGTSTERRQRWQRFFEDYHRVVIWAAWKHSIKVEEDREDIWSELLYRLMRNDCRIIRRFLDNPNYTDTSFRTYLRVAATNLAKDHHRRASAGNKTDIPDWAELDSATPTGIRSRVGLNPAGEDYGSRWTRDFVDWLLPEKSSASYRVFALKALNDLSNNEVAQQLDLSVSNVAQKIHYFKVKLISAMIGTLELTDGEAALLDERRGVLLSCLRLSDEALRWWRQVVQEVNEREEQHTDKIFPLKEADYDFPFIAKALRRNKDWVTGKFQDYRRRIGEALAGLAELASGLRDLLNSGRDHITRVFGKAVTEGDGSD